jgi:cobalt/nickel transport system permease protein
MIQIDKLSNVSPMKDIHPVEKALFAFSFLFFSILTKNVGVALITFIVMSTVILWHAKIAMKTYLKMLLLPSIFIISSVIVILVSISPIGALIVNPLWLVQIGNWSIYIGAAQIKQSIQLTATVMASISAMYFFILTTPIHQWIWLLQKCRFPSLFIELTVFTYHFIFILLEKMQQIAIAQSSRLGYRNARTWMNSSAKLIVALFIKSLQSAQALQMAIDSRGGEEGLMTVNITQSYKRLNWLIIMLSISGLFVLSILNV